MDASTIDEISDAFEKIRVHLPKLQQDPATRIAESTSALQKESKRQEEILNRQTLLLESQQKATTDILTMLESLKPVPSKSTRSEHEAHAKQVFLQRDRERLRFSIMQSDVCMVNSLLEIFGIVYFSRSGGKKTLLSEKRRRLLHGLGLDGEPIPADDDPKAIAEAEVEEVPPPWPDADITSV